MRNIMTVLGRDFKSYFSSPVAYVVIGLFLMITGVFFYLLTSSFLQYAVNLQWQAARMRQPAPPVNVNHMILRPLFSNISVVTLFVLPMITMRSFSEDKRTGTMELLLTSPVTTAQIVLGKFLAAFALYAIMVLITWVYPLIIILFGEPDVMPIAVSYLGILAMGAASIALGIWVSSMTENQIISAMGTFVALLFLWLVGWFSHFSTGFLGGFFNYISIIEHFDDFAKGIFDTGHLVYYLSLGGIMLFFAHQSIESLKWRS
ncbi:MAG: ABC transporter permease subunit [Candidatus Neomarinimicrobiota bacterium]